jgi:flagellar basal-body rod modification protein FlgD
MPVDAIGSVLNARDAELNPQNSINQESFLRLFVSQLQFQDPLEPVDNREFLAQLAQFSGLETARQTGESIESLLFMTSGQQAYALLNRSVEILGDGNVTTSGTVTAVRFTEAGPELTVTSTAGPVLTGIRLPQIVLVRP